MSRIDVLGVGFDDLTRENAIDLCKRLIDEHRGAYMVTPNPEIVMAAWENAELHDAICNADLVIPDGIGVVKAARIIGTPLKERLPGIEIGEAILEYAAQTGKSVFLLGAKPGVADAAKEKMQETYPGLNVCGTNDGYFKDDDPVIEKINAAQPDFLMVCLGAPKQELWMAQNAERLDVGLMAGLGGSLDVFAGTVMRAPKAWQRMNAEWLYRLCSRLEAEEIKYHHIVFPRYDNDSSALIKMYLSGQFGSNPNDVNAYTASAFFAVDRFASYRTDWGDIYNSGGFVLSDRYTTSNAVHQGAKLPDEELPAFFEWLYDFEYVKLGLPKPDLVIYLDVDVETSLRRMKHRQEKTHTSADIHEKDIEYLKNCLRVADKAADYYGWTRIPFKKNGVEREIDEKHEEIYSIIKSAL